ncbi:ABC-type transport system permease protein (plasmid) [Natrialba magadii ATCC 43099]|uniref:ABC transporter n=1 Tax=Natrialba magadii (strain ATCC 43099 / DSM 3394 / CCM 3739 / CIP 104546 / IAM 13178 / JCM 8861 / NBRC 102185 / NCIMB 2190 / MS3) TaxID=547559 RepID=D3T218_NATMM|nr:ABC transporter permease [Natrialba magadii]ADD07627.1 ABC-type transport system permease protein [Natrialba magadii ATCC 43099]ELY27104.1 ABC transporter [Natrialba magadii ATCC 43099]
MSTPTESGTTDREVARSANTFTGDVWVNFKRWNLKAVRNPFVLVVSLAQPFIFLVLFTEVFGNVAGGAVSEGLGSGVDYTTFLVPAIAIQVALASAVTSGIGLVNDIENGMFEKVLVSPMNRTAVFVGKTLAEVFRIALQIAIILGLGVLLGAEITTGVVGAAGIMAVGILFSFWFIAFSNMLAVLTRDQESTIIGANLLQFPLLFLSSAFLPLEVLPNWIQLFARINPVTYGVDAARAIMLDEDVMTVLEVTAFGGALDTIVPAVAVLAGLGLVFGAGAVHLLSKASSSEVR